jgi:hypothetical protein
MKKSQVVESLKNQMDSFYSLEQVIKIVESIEDETSIITKETLSELVDNIRQVLDRNSDKLIDKDSAEFEINYDNRIELSFAEVDIDCIIDYIEACIEECIKEVTEE